MNNIDKELPELKRVVQYLNRDENIKISLKQLKNLFLDAEETKLSNDIWDSLENTESNTIKKGEMNKVHNISNMYGKSDPEKLKEKLLNNTYERPLIIKFNDRYHLVAGNTRLSTAAALGMNPYVIIADIPSKLTKDTEGIEKFMEILDNRFNLNYELLKFIVYFIENSGCEKIEFEDFKHPSLGLALHDRVLISDKVLNMGLNMCLFVIFHEIAHQYQYKKYGREKMYKYYLNQLPLEEAVEFIRKMEIVADEFGARKIRELQSRDLIEKNFKPIQMYKNTPISFIEKIVSDIRNKIESRNITSPEGISEFFFNMIKNNL